MTVRERNKIRTDMRDRVLAAMSSLLMTWPGTLGPEGHAVMTAVLDAIQKLPTKDVTP